MTYEEQLRDYRWLARRRLIVLRDGGRCRYCGGEANLQVHHLRYRGMAWEVPDEWLVTLCEVCHERAHAPNGS